MPDSFNSLEIYILTSTCLNIPQTDQLWVISFSPLLSISSFIGNFNFNPILLRTLITDIMYCSHITTENSSAAITDSAIIGINLLLNYVSAQFIKVDQSLTLFFKLSFAQSELLRTVTPNRKSIHPFQTTFGLNSSTLSVVVTTYFIILFISLICDSIVQLITIEHSRTEFRISGLDQRIIRNIFPTPDM